MEVLGIDKNTIIINNLQASIINPEQAINLMDKFKIEPTADGLKL
jgi:hypothetical protein